jgi:tRNA-specific 2-thiouridylase
MDVFKRAVIDNLADTYLAGATPNPCVQCNGVLKFRVLLKRAMALGASHLATGHYAQIDPGPPPLLRMALDRNKDQSYFLVPVSPDALERTLFPLGALTKPEVRAHAERLGLLTAEKPESQEICFIEDDDHARFVRTHRPDADGAGTLVDPEGRVLGEHDGYFRYTIGQRRGTGVSLGKPAYVEEIRPESKEVVVTTDLKRLERGGVRLTLENWFARPGPHEVVSVRIRHRGQLHPAHVLAGKPAEVRFLEPVRAISAGQSAVIYDGDRVLGGGTIARALMVDETPRPEAP